jgi:1,2-diacylglycerol 3-alpha-glucosyltransferase
MPADANRAFSPLASRRDSRRTSRSSSFTEGSTSGWLRRIGLLNDYVRIPYANGSSFATQFLYREFSERGHEVTVVGPRDPASQPEDLPERHVCLPSLPLRNHPGVWLPMPTPDGLARVAAQRFDVVLGQSTSELADLGVWLRWTQHVPFLCVHTVHFPSAFNVLLPDGLLNNGLVNGFCYQRVVPWLERHTASIYSRSDGLIVLSRGLERYWRERGVTVPIHVIPRSVEPRIFDHASDRDPFPAEAPPGHRLLVVCRHTREKEVSRLLRIFARHVSPAVPGATLTLVGDGPDHDSFRDEAEQLGVAHRCFFPGEFPVTDIPTWYRHADLFVYTSLSETYGQVVSEAMWCGLPVVAFADDMGVSHQLEDTSAGILVPAGPDTGSADARFGTEVVRLLQQPVLRRALSVVAERETRERAHPARCIQRYYDAFEHARRHCRATMGERVSRPYAHLGALVRWTWVQGVAAGLGLIRSPAVVNRHGRKQPGWHEFDAGRPYTRISATETGEVLVNLSDRLSPPGATGAA